MADQRERSDLARVRMLPVLLAGCTWLAGIDDPTYRSPVPLVAPWTEQALPVDGAVVTFADGETLTVRHAGAPPQELGPRYAQALEAKGYALLHDTTAGGIFNQTWGKPGQRLALTVLDGGEEAIVALSVLPPLTP